MIDHDTLTQLVWYDSNTGEFTRRTATNNAAKVGDKAGNVNSRGYVVLSVGGKMYLAHRLAWFYVTKEWPPEYIDHINRCKKDNRIANLRCCTNAENQKNRGAPTANVSGYRGVFPSNGRWRARARLNGRRYSLGIFDTREEASEAYEKFAVDNHKQFYFGG